MWGDPKDAAEKASSDVEEEDDEEEDEDESSENEVSDGPSSAVAGQKGKVEMTREERRAAAKAEKLAAIARKAKKAAAPGDMPSSGSESEEDEDEDEGDMRRNPNHTAKSRSQAFKQPQSPSETSSPRKAGDSANLSRREREALEKEKARERYQKRLEKGETDAARADLARLDLIRKEREAARMRKDAEIQDKKDKMDNDQAREQLEAKRRANAMGGEGGAKSTKPKRGK